MHQNLRDKYNVNRDGFNKNKGKIIVKENKKCNILLLFLITVNSIYFFSGIIFYYYYIHKTFMNEPDDMNILYNKFNKIINFLCNNVKQIEC